jgi:hypothetical protein
MIDAGTPPFDLLAVVLDGQKSAAPREIGGVATMKRRTVANRLATREESFSTAMRRAASKPSPIRSIFSSLKCRSTAMSGY